MFMETRGKPSSLRLAVYTTVQTQSLARGASSSGGREGRLERLLVTIPRSFLLSVEVSLSNMHHPDCSRRTGCCRAWLTPLSVCECVNEWLYVALDKSISIIPLKKKVKSQWTDACFKSSTKCVCVCVCICVCIYVRLHVFVHVCMCVFVFLPNQQKKPN